MKYGFVKVASAVPKIEVANCRRNGNQILDLIDQADKKGVQVLVFPELSITGSTCGDLFFQDLLLDKGQEELIRIKNHTIGMEILVTVGLPFKKDGKLFNVAATIQNGKILGLTPKKHIPNHRESYESRYFNSANSKAQLVKIQGEEVPFGTNILFSCKSFDKLVISVEIGEDLWVANPPSSNHCIAGASLVLNPSAFSRTIEKDNYQRDLVRIQSAKLLTGYINTNAGEGESTTDLVFSGHSIIAENGTILEEAEFKYNNLLISDIDIEKLNNERNRNSIFDRINNKDYSIVEFTFDTSKVNDLTRKINPSPFIPYSRDEREKRCKEIINIQAHGLKKRLEHTGIKNAVIGLSGGLDSTLALLVTKRAYDLMDMDPKGIICVTMPCFGTTDRTYQNALDLAKYIGASLRQIPIEAALIQHFKDIGHDINVHDITYENSQARKRTQILMDISNQCNGLVIGTGDMSELVLGWATYNGDHMSMYGLNASIPKTMVKYLVGFYAGQEKDDKLKKVLYDILDTPVSPELLPPKDGVIAQKTEDIVGPYELHDFFLYYILRHGFSPSKVYYLATLAFDDKYDKQTIYKWLNNFYRRFFSQQFKRSCLPDSPKVGTISVSPRGDLRMPSDASVKLWLDDLKKCNPSQ